MHEDLSQTLANKLRNNLPDNISVNRDRKHRQNPSTVINISTASAMRFKGDDSQALAVVGEVHNNINQVFKSLDQASIASGYDRVVIGIARDFEEDQIAIPANLKGQYGQHRIQKDPSIETEGRAIAERILGTEDPQNYIDMFYFTETYLKPDREYPKTLYIFVTDSCNSFGASEFEEKIKAQVFGESGIADENQRPFDENQLPAFITLLIKNSLEQTARIDYLEGGTVKAGTDNLLRDLLGLNQPHAKSNFDLIKDGMDKLGVTCELQQGNFYFSLPNCPAMVLLNHQMEIPGFLLDISIDQKDLTPQLIAKMATLQERLSAESSSMGSDIGIFLIKEGSPDLSENIEAAKWINDTMRVFAEVFKD